jgi:cell division protein ZipA
METLRWILLLVGVVIIAAVYFSGRRSRRDVVDEISSADPVAPLERDEPRVEIRRRHPEINDVDHELSKLSNMIAENRRPSVAVPEKPAVTVLEKPAATATVTEPAPAPAPAPAKPAIASAPAAQKPETAAPAVKPQTARPAPPPEDKIIVVYIMSPPGGRFAGNDVKRAVETAGMRHGNMSIFHRLVEPDNLDSHAVFSLANSVEPGIFDLDALDDFSTPGLTLFMQLPGPLNGITALDSMLAAAHIIATELHGELRDQSRSVLGKQTIEHMHSEIIEYQRRQRLARATP